MGIAAAGVRGAQGPLIGSCHEKPSALDGTITT